MVDNASSLKITVIGTGYLGLTHAVCMADLGHDVLAIDTDISKLSQAAAGEVPFFEPGLGPQLRKNMDAGRLRFTRSYADVGAFGEVHFLCVGTPEEPKGRADLSYLRTAVDALAPHLGRRCLVVGKSTVPVGTARALRDRIRVLAGPRADLAWSPEFLREGRALRDSLAPDRIVFGVASADAADLLRRVYAVPLAAGIPCLVMDLETAELVKLAANAFLATKLSFINAMAEICDAVGADVTRLAEALGQDRRIGDQFLSPGLGFGGGCLPKDVRVFSTIAASLGVPRLADLLRIVDEINLARRERVLEIARMQAGGIRGCRIAVLGIAFKPNTDDIRDSPSLAVCQHLASEGAIVSVHDPVAMPKAAKTHPQLRYASSAREAAQGAHLVLILTEWAEYGAIDPVTFGAVVARKILVDARGILNAESWREAGWAVHLFGRPQPPLARESRTGDDF